MLIKVKRGWELAERLVTPEALVMNRRGMLKAAGLLAVSGVLADCGKGANTSDSGGGAPKAAASATSDPTASLYPAKRNAAYMVDRPITPESIVTTYNNYYEFGFDKGFGDRILRIEGGEATGEIFELANIARPGIIEQHPQGPCSYLPGGFAGPSVFADEMSR